MGATRAQINARNRRAGAAWETLTVKSLRERGYDCERLRLSGKQDEGDISFRAGGKHHVLECKNVKTWSYSILLGYIAEAMSERTAYAKKRLLADDKVQGAVFLKRHNASWDQGVVAMPVTEYLKLVGNGQG